jgi:hypothetical protein
MITEWIRVRGSVLTSLFSQRLCHGLQNYPVWKLTLHNSDDAEESYTSESLASLIEGMITGFLAMLRDV